MAKKPRIKKPKLPPLKKKLKGEVYVANETDKQIKELKDSLHRSQAEVDSLKQVIKVRIK